MYSIVIIAPTNPISCLVGKLLGCGAVYLSDWLEHDQLTLTLWHGGMAPFQLRYSYSRRIRQKRRHRSSLLFGKVLYSHLAARSIDMKNILGGWWFGLVWA